MDHAARVFTSWNDADEAEVAYYARLTPRSVLTCFSNSSRSIEDRSARRENDSSEFVALFGSRKIDYLVVADGAFPDFPIGQQAVGELVVA